MHLEPQDKHVSAYGQEFPVISPREAEVLDALHDGLQNKQIARRLGISEQTVKNHLGAVYEATGLRSRLLVALWWDKHRGEQHTAQRAVRPAREPAPPKVPLTLAERIERYIERAPNGEHDCWLWNGPLNEGIFPYVSWQGRKVYVRRHLYQQRYGPLEPTQRITVVRERCAPGLWFRCVQPLHCRVGHNEHWRRQHL